MRINLFALIYSGDVRCIRSGGGGGVLFTSHIRKSNNLMNNIHKRAPKFTYDNKGNKLSDIAPPKMKAYCQRISLIFALLFLFLRFLNMQ